MGIENVRACYVIPSPGATICADFRTPQDCHCANPQTGGD